jgi:uncharacterized protein
MKLSSSFSVPAPRERVFAHFLDADSMRVCVPGCTELTRPDDRHYRGTLVNQISHVRFRAGFGAEITELERPSAVRALLSGEDRKLGSSIKVTADLGLAEGETPDSSTVEFSLDLALWGTLGRLGESIVRKRTEEVQRQFVATFTRVCEAGEPGPDNPVVKELTEGSAPAAPAAAPGPVSAPVAAAPEPEAEPEVEPERVGTRSGWMPGAPNGGGAAGPGRLARVLMLVRTVAGQVVTRVTARVSALRERRRKAGPGPAGAAPGASDVSGARSGANRQ